MFAIISHISENAIFENQNDTFRNTTRGDRMIHKLSGIYETVDFREDEQICLYYNDEYEKLSTALAYFF